MSLNSDSQNDRINATLSSIDEMEKNWSDTIQGFTQNIQQMATQFAVNVMSERGIHLPAAPRDDDDDEKETDRKNMNEITSNSTMLDGNALKIGDEILYKYQKSSDRCDAWYEGKGEIVDLFQDVKEQKMVRVKLDYGSITFKLDNIQTYKPSSSESVTMNAQIADVPQRFFVYGTLRDDDDSNAFWTKDFVKGCIAQNARLYGFKLYKLQGCNFPFATKASKSDFIAGRLIYWNENSYFFSRKLRKADQIEGYQGTLKDNLYQREAVDVTTDNNKTVKAIVYYRTNQNMKNAVAIPHGDWLKRGSIESQ